MKSRKYRGRSQSHSSRSPSKSSRSRSRSTSRSTTSSHSSYKRHHSSRVRSRSSSYDEYSNSSRSYRSSRSYSKRKSKASGSRSSGRRQRTSSFSKDLVYSVGCVCAGGNQRQIGHAPTCQYYTQPPIPAHRHMEPKYNGTYNGPPATFRSSTGMHSGMQASYSFQDDYILPNHSFSPVPYYGASLYNHPADRRNDDMPGRASVSHYIKDSPIFLMVLF